MFSGTDLSLLVVDPSMRRLGVLRRGSPGQVTRLSRYISLVDSGFPTTFDPKPIPYQNVKSDLPPSPRPLSMDRYRPRLADEDVTNGCFAKAASLISIVSTEEDIDTIIENKQLPPADPS